MSFSMDDMTAAVVAHVRASDVRLQNRVGDSDLPSGDRGDDDYLPVIAVYPTAGGESSPSWVDDQFLTPDFLIRSVGRTPSSARRMADHVFDLLTSQQSFVGFAGWSCMRVTMPGERGGIDREDEGAFTVWSVAEIYRFHMSAS